MKDVLLTKEGLQKLKNELTKLINEDRLEIVQKVKEAREYGDLSENNEYETARNQQSMIEGRIEELEAILKRARVIDEATAKANHGMVTVGSTVEVEVEGDMETFQIVGSAESDPAGGNISTESPLGKALLGSKVGQKVSVALPDGSATDYTITKIN